MLNSTVQIDKENQTPFGEHKRTDSQVTHLSRALATYVPSFETRQTISGQTDGACCQCPSQVMKHSDK